MNNQIKNLRVKHLAIIGLTTASASIHLNTLGGSIYQAKVSETLGNSTPINIMTVTAAITAFKKDASTLVSQLVVASDELNKVDYTDPVAIGKLCENLGAKLAEAGLISFSTVRSVAELLTNLSLPDALDSLQDQVMDAVRRASEITAKIEEGTIRQDNGVELLAENYGLVNVWTVFSDQITALCLLHDEAGLMDDNESLTTIGAVRETAPA